MSIQAKHRAPLEDLWSCIQREAYGEYACCGVFLPGFLDKLSKSDSSISKRDIARLKKLTKVIGKGAREVLRVQTEQNIISRGIELRKLSIKSFLTSVRPLDEDGQKKKKGRSEAKATKADLNGDSDSVGESGFEGKEKEVRLKYSIKAGSVIKNWLVNKLHLGWGVGEFRYW
jgi:hypothetical protein